MEYDYETEYADKLRKQFEPEDEKPKTQESPKKQYARQYAAKNRKKLNEYHANYYRTKIKTDPEKWAQRQQYGREYRAQAKKMNQINSFTLSEGIAIAVATIRKSHEQKS